jgi:uncharacterized protein (DUF427 family)
MWNYRGGKRPPFAIEPGEGQESVWDYPRPPDLRPDRRLVEVRTEPGEGAGTIARSRRAVRVCETASPPTFYLPPGDVDTAQLIAARGSSYCEWKGQAAYWALASDPGRVVAWSYPEPKPAFGELANWICFYPGRVACYVDGERVQAQSGGFYGGWITSEIVGPFKGEPGTGGW